MSDLPDFDCLKLSSHDLTEQHLPVIEKHKKL